MNLLPFALAAAAVFAPAALSAATFESGSWAAARIGQSCHVFTLRAHRDTSGALVFSFGPGGYNTGFTYEYAPWPGESGAPWDEGDFVLLEADGQELWLGEEMFAGPGPNGYSAELTSGFVPEMIAATLGAQSDISVSFDRAALGEVWLYGKFATDGFAASLARAGEWCGFDPQRLPSS